VSLRRPRFTICLIIAVVGVGALVGAAIAFASNGNAPVAALTSGTTAGTAEPANVENLAEAVTRWNLESSDTRLNTPLASQAADLLTNVGNGNDTLSAFPTASGQVCFEIKAAGTCGRVDTPTGITFGILSGGSGGTRLFGVAADQVTRVQVQVNGNRSDALLRNNGFYFQLPAGVGGADVEQVISYWNDGSSHVFPVHPK